MKTASHEHQPYTRVHTLIIAVGEICGPACGCGSFIDADAHEYAGSLRSRSGNDGAVPRARSARCGARRAAFGAVIVSKGEIVAKAANCVSSEGGVTRHAGLVALSRAQKSLKRKRLPDCTLYSIVESCPMCSFPTREARISRVVFALSSPVMGGYSKWTVLKDEHLSSKLPEVFGSPPEIVSGFLSARAEQVWRDWNPIAWRCMKRRGCFGPAAELPERHDRRR
ncbi:nucleoside deaminase [Bradyrhizobium sp. CCBAU 11357]|uniref:nucleoside deaminase n=1 Tax=Bradyrhizobium sp. CCBAU 11357 TaxID=1630808 RepID=UPI003FA40E07